MFVNRVSIKKSFRCEKLSEGKSYRIFFALEFSKFTTARRPLSGLMFSDIPTHISPLHLNSLFLVSKSQIKVLCYWWSNKN